MDGRKALSRGTILEFPGFSCELGEEIGRGGNAIVYRGRYRDAHAREQFHLVYVKELLPMHPQGFVYRLEDGSVFVEPEGQDYFAMHRQSFEAGNRANLKLLEEYPDQISANLNTYAFGGTLYTILGVSGGESLEKLAEGPMHSVQSLASRMLSILDALEVFHKSGLPHLDVAPDNILILGSGQRERALLIDYSSTAALASNRDGSFLCNIKQGYTAPEVRSGRLRSIGYPADLYSVTAVFFRLLMGRALTCFEMTRPIPPDVSACPALQDAPETVKAMVRDILRRGLQTLPTRRYPDISAMRVDLEELADRIEGVGITHWALWEAGRRQVERMVQENPALSFLANADRIYPSMLFDGQRSYPVTAYFHQMQESCLLLAGGGMGKTTALLRAAISSDKEYSPAIPAVFYLSLYGMPEGKENAILDSILEGLHFRPETYTFADARKVLFELLDRPADSRDGNAPTLILLLDGLNEVSGDIQTLLAEIRHLSALRGVRLVVAGRADEGALSFLRVHLTELSEEVVREELAKGGLLLPENPAMRQMLRTPLLLSMFLASGQMAGRQVRAGTPEELLETYLSALKEKAIRDLAEQEDRRWQIEAAMEFVLPAFAKEIHKKGRGLEDRELLPVAEKCYRLLQGRLSRRFFPKWIGRTAAIRGGAKNAEEWYGQIAHDILWKQLGLLMRDAQGRYMVSHQIIEENLLETAGKNDGKVRRFRWTRRALAAGCVVILLVSCIFAYRYFLAPKPYNEKYAENVLYRGLDSYISAGRQYELLATALDAAREGRKAYQEKVMDLKKELGFDGMNRERARKFLAEMLASGEVMP